MGPWYDEELGTRAKGLWWSLAELRRRDAARPRHHVVTGDDQVIFV
jgi:hypothetical protein